MRPKLSVPGLTFCPVLSLSFLAGLCLLEVSLSECAHRYTVWSCGVGVGVGVGERLAGLMTLVPAVGGTPITPDLETNSAAITSTTTTSRYCHTHILEISHCHISSIHPRLMTCDFEWLLSSQPYLRPGGKADSFPSP